MEGEDTVNEGSTVTDGVRVTGTENEGRAVADGGMQDTNVT